MSKLINSIVDRNFVEADSIISETVELIMTRKLEEAKKITAAKMCEQPHMMNRTAAELVRKDVIEEDEQLDESVSVKKKEYSWGKMVTVHHGNKVSYPLHPEHQEKIGNLKHDEKVSFKDETGSRVTAHRDGNTIHLSKNKHNETTSVPFHHFEKDLNEARINIIKARIRGGKIQRRKKVSNVPGMTLRSGKLQRMSAAERRRRKMGARKAVRKRAPKMNRALMKRKRSLMKRRALGI